MTLPVTSAAAGRPQPVPTTASGTRSRLTEADAARIAAAMAATHAETTRACYAGAWRRWANWWASRELIPLPAEPGAVSAYLTERAETGVSFSTLDLACSAIGHEHRRQGLADPTDRQRSASSAAGCAGSSAPPHAVRHPRSA